MRLSGILFASAATLLLAGSALAQSAGGSMSGPSMSGPSMSGPSMKGGMANGGGMKMNSMGGFDVFSRENMAMMIVDRERATKGMTAEQAADARKEEMAKDRAETPEQRQARKAKYDAEWLKLTAAEKSDALNKWDAQLKQIQQRGMMSGQPANK
jgi:hypothetical protein